MEKTWLTLLILLFFLLGCGEKNDISDNTKNKKDQGSSTPKPSTNSPNTDELSEDDLDDDSNGSSNSGASRLRKAPSKTKSTNSKQKSSTSSNHPSRTKAKEAFAPTKNENSTQTEK